jgi:hypothetical protein
MISVDDAFGGEFMQDRQAAAAGIPIAINVVPFSSGREP